MLTEDINVSPTSFMEALLYKLTSLGPLQFTLWSAGIWLPGPTYQYPAYITIPVV
jgi:hypothetical protein